MTVDDLAEGLVKTFEGCRLTAYRDVAGLWTIGWGHLLSRQRGIAIDMIYHGLTWTQGQADAALVKDMAPAIGDVRRLITVPLTPGQEAALRSFTFNVGAGALQASTLRQKLNRGEYEDAADELLKWCRAGGRQVAGLLRRRQAERALFLAASN